MENSIKVSGWRRHHTILHILHFLSSKNIYLLQGGGPGGNTDIDLKHLDFPKYQHLKFQSSFEVPPWLLPPSSLNQ